MPTDIEQLQSIKQQALQQLADLQTAPKPSYSLDGQSVSWQQYADSLRQTIEWCDLRLASAEPYEIRSRGTT